MSVAPHIATINRKKIGRCKSEVFSGQNHDLELDDLRIYFILSWLIEPLKSGEYRDREKPRRRSLRTFALVYDQIGKLSGALAI